MSYIKKTAENLFDDLIKDTEEIPIKLKYLKIPKTPPTPNNNRRNRNRNSSSILNVEDIENDPFADHIIEQEKIRQELKEKKEKEVKLKRLKKKCKNLKVRVERLSKKKINLLIRNMQKKTNKQEDNKNSKMHSLKRQRSSSDFTPENKKRKISTGTLKTKAALKEMPKLKIHVKSESFLSKSLKLKKRISKPTQKFETSLEIKKSRPKKKSPATSPVKSPIKKSKTLANKRTPQRQNTSKTISKKIIEKKYGKIYLQCHVKVLRTKLNDLDTNNLLEKSLKDSRKKYKGGLNKSVSFKEFVSVDFYDPEIELTNNRNEENTEKVQTNMESNYLNHSDSSLKKSYEMTISYKDACTSEFAGTRTKSYSPLKTDIARRSAVLKKSDEKIVPKIVLLDSGDEDDDSYNTEIDDIKKSSDERQNDGGKEEENAENKLSETLPNKENEDDKQNNDDTNVDFYEGSDVNQFEIKRESDNKTEDVIENCLINNEKENVSNEVSDQKNEISYDKDNDDINQNYEIIDEDEIANKNNKEPMQHNEKKLGNNEIRESNDTGCTDDIEKTISQSLIRCSTPNQLTITSSEESETNSNFNEDKLKNSKKDDNDFFNVVRIIENRQIKSPTSELDEDLRLTPEEEKENDSRTLPLTKPPKSVLASIYESIKSKFPGSSQSSGAIEKDDDESFDIPKITELQQFETDDDSALLGDPVLGGRDRDDTLF